MVQTLSAQTCCSGGVPLAGNLGLPAGEAGQLQVGISYDLNRLRSLFTGSEALNDGSRIRNTQTILLESSYAINDRWSIDILLPYIRQERVINRGNTATDVTNGLGDAVALLRYQWIQPDFGRRWQWASGAGIKFPNGAADRENEFGFTYNADLQPGSKAWDLILWNRLSHQLASRPSLSIFLTAVHRRRGINDDYLAFNNPVTMVRQAQTYQFGTETQLTLGLSDQLLFFDRLINPGLSLLFRHAEGDRTNGEITPSTGGDFLFLQPSIGLTISASLSWQLAADLPVYTKVTGTQVAPTLRLNTGFLYHLSTKQ
ncbi:hypothetical protein [Neolewinella agarilytica]|uniref:hypothetical protein n=1 Tax=Neolewinella agarilytica TaxID=478744 RepID=UPI0011137697|nr:hypothetical protein [Neolewinella agarilytica]